MAKLGKSLSGIVALVAALALAACGSPETSNNSNTTTDPYATGGDAQPVPVPPPPPAPKQYALHDAAKLGLISYEVVGNGSSSGESLEIKVRRTASEPIRVYVAPGTVFRTGSKGVQSMVAKSIAREIGEAVAEQAVEAVLEESGVIELADNAVHNLVVEAYCRDFELENPSGEDGFTASSVDPRAAAIFEASDSRGLSLGAKQAAIWMDRGVTQAAIAEKFDATPADFEAASQLLAQLPPRR